MFLSKLLREVKKEDLSSVSAVFRYVAVVQNINVCKQTNSKSFPDLQCTAAPRGKQPDGG